MKKLDLLNELQVSERIRSATVSAKIINQVNPSSFLGDGVRVSTGCKVVQARICSVSYGGDDYFCEAWIYATVPETVEIGEFYFLTGTLVGVSSKSISKEVALFNFRKDASGWVLVPSKVTEFSRSPIKDTFLQRNLDYWVSFPYTLSTGDESIITPITRMVETEVMMRFGNSLIGTTLEFPKPNLKTGVELTALQYGCLEEMLVVPVLQVQVENEYLLSVEDLMKDIKTSCTPETVVYDLRVKRLPLDKVVENIRSKGFISENGQRVILLVHEVQDGVPSIILGSECIV